MTVAKKGPKQASGKKQTAKSKLSEESKSNVSEKDEGKFKIKLESSSQSESELMSKADQFEDEEI